MVHYSCIQEVYRIEANTKINNSISVYVCVHFMHIFMKDEYECQDKTSEVLL